jgi:hypothetical protein
MTPGLQVAIDCADPHALARFWAAATGYEVEDHHDFVQRMLAEGQAEVERLLGLGATRLWDGRQGPHRWITLADPEGNEFCVG